MPILPSFKPCLVLKILRFLFSIYGFAIFLALMFLLLPLFVISFCLPAIRGGNLIFSLSRFWADSFFILTGIRYRAFYQAAVRTDEQYIFISNHISYLDIPMMMKVVRGRHLRILGKAEMNRVPIFGSIYKRGTVSVDRADPKARYESVERLKRFLNIRISIFICPEGTFNMTHEPLKSFYDGAFKIAIETQKPIQPILFLDTYDRLNYKSIFSLNPGQCRAIFLPSTPTVGMKEEDMTALKSAIFNQMKKSLEEHHATWIKD